MSIESWSHYITPSSTSVSVFCYIYCDCTEFELIQFVDKFQMTQMRHLYLPDAYKTTDKAMLALLKSTKAKDYGHCSWQQKTMINNAE